MKVLLFFIFFSTNNLYSQLNYIEYHKQIVFAEKYLLENKLDSSLSIYNSLFQKYPKYFVRDCVVALQVAILKRDNSMIDEMMKHCYSKGITGKKLFLIPIIKKYFDSTNINNSNITNRTQCIEIDKKYSSYRVNYLKNINFLLRGELFVRTAKDQFYKRIPSEWMGDKYLDSIYAQILDSNMMYLVNIVKTIGYPGEHLIGIEDFNFDNIYLSKGYELKMESIANIFFFHHMYGYQFVQEELYKAIIKGDIHPREYALIHEWSYADIYNKSMGPKYILPLKYKPLVKIQPKKYYYNYFLHKLDYLDDLKTVNAHRWKIGMSSLEHDRKKSMLEKKYGLMLNFGFIPSMNYE